MNIANWLERAGLAIPQEPALMEGAQVTRTYGDFAQRVACLSTSLRDVWGLDPGDHVAIVAKNSPDYLELLFAIWHSGLVAVPINAKLHPREIAWILQDSEAKAVFASKDLADSLWSELPACVTSWVTIGTDPYESLFDNDPAPLVEREAEDLAWIFYTSGTTGQPKGAMLSHRNLAVMSWAYLSEIDPCEQGDLLYHAAPISHGSGLYSMATILARGVNAVAASGGFDEREVLDFITDHPNCSMFAAPTMIRRMVDVAGKGWNKAQNIRTIIWGGAPMHVEDIKGAVEAFGSCLAQIYGQGESPMTISCLPKSMIGEAVKANDDDCLASAGIINSAVSVAIKGAEKPGDIGEILAKGDVVMSGYWNRAEASAKTLIDGWLHTGDVGCLDAKGRLHLKDRSKDVIISGGSNIYPREVEEVLLTHPEVSEVSVIGRPDEEWGEVVIAYYVGAAEPQELDQLCLASIARFKRPKAYIRLENLPKSNYGKILKSELRQRDSELAANQA